VTAGAGILFPHEDAQALSDAIKKLHENQKYYQEIAEACYQRALQYDINGMVQKYEDVYRKVAAK
jgi:glycosyltransferase involved in cell wall biosynthesis